MSPDKNAVDLLTFPAGYWQKIQGIGHRYAWLIMIDFDDRLANYV